MARSKELELVCFSSVKSLHFSFVLYSCVLFMNGYLPSASHFAIPRGSKNSMCSWSVQSAGEEKHQSVYHARILESQATVA